MKRSICLFRRVILPVWLIVALGLPGYCPAETAYPMLMSARPVAVQVGTTAEIMVSSRYTMTGAYQVLVSGQGVKAEVEPREAKSEDGKKPLEKVKIKVTASKDAQPGVRDFRV